MFSAYMLDGAVVHEDVKYFYTFFSKCYKINQFNSRYIPEHILFQTVNLLCFEDLYCTGKQYCISSENKYNMIISKPNII